jgi:hypothetical protein
LSKAFHEVGPGFHADKHELGGLGLVPNGRVQRLIVRQLVMLGAGPRLAKPRDAIGEHHAEDAGLIAREGEGEQIGHEPVGRHRLLDFGA